MRFQNHATAVEDLLAMFAVEFVTCHLDFLVAVPDRPGPVPDVSELVVATLDGGLRGQRPASWDDLAYGPGQRASAAGCCRSGRARHPRIPVPGLWLVPTRSASFPFTGTT
jgi:hypothetical protein